MSAPWSEETRYIIGGRNFIISKDNNGCVLAFARINALFHQGYKNTILNAIRGICPLHVSAPVISGSIEKTYATKSCLRHLSRGEICGI